LLMTYRIHFFVKNNKPEPHIFEVPRLDVAATFPRQGSRKRRETCQAMSIGQKRCESLISASEKCLQRENIAELHVCIWSVVKLIVAM